MTAQKNPDVMQIKGLLTSVLTNFKCIKDVFNKMKNFQQMFKKKN